MDLGLTPWEDAPGRLRQALERDELTLFAQPVLSLRGDAHYPMAEALVRLREEENALLPPGEFLPAFEHYGMMPSLDRWVVRRAVRELAGGLTVGQLSINVSRQTFAAPEFAAQVAAELAAARVPAWSLVFEIDESDLLQQLDAAAQFGKAMKAIGCRLLIDGFGRRSVSFAPLTRLKVDYVKVDGVIVRGLLSSKMAQTKLAAIVRVAEVTGMGVICECVEDPATLTALRASGVGFAQGFGLRLPSPVEDLRVPRA